MLKRKIANPAYLTSVYAAYNFGVTLSNTDEVILVNSDMIFSPNWLAILLSANRDKSVISCSLVERNHPKFSTFPGAIQKNFGSTFLFFKRKSWEKFTRTKADFESTNLVQGGPFMPTLFRKSWFEEYGGYHEGNIGDGEDTERVVEYSDIDFFKKLRDRGISHLSASNSFCYHFKEGERETSLGVFLENRIFAKYRKWKTS
jgi:GT2 family glycosyltransferase